jgi:hypothetical protein
LANSFKKLVLTFDMWFSKIIKLVWPLMKVLMNQKTNSKKLPWTIGFLYQNFHENYFKILFFPKPRIEDPMILDMKLNQKWRLLTKSKNHITFIKNAIFGGCF